MGITKLHHRILSVKNPLISTYFLKLFHFCIISKDFKSIMYFITIISYKKFSFVHDLCKNAPNYEVQTRFNCMTKLWQNRTSFISQSNIIHTKKFVIMNFTVKIRYLKKSSTDFTAKITYCILSAYQMKLKWDRSIIN